MMTAFCLILSAMRYDCTQSACVIEHVALESLDDGSVAKDASVLTSGGKIVSVGLAGSVPTPEGAVHIDGRGRVLAPAFIETVTSLGLTEIGAEKIAREDGPRAAIAPALSPMEAFNPRSVWIPLARAAGVLFGVTASGGEIVGGRGVWFEAGEKATLDPLRPLVIFGSVGEHAALSAGNSRAVLWLKLREAFADARFYRANKRAIESGDTRPLSVGLAHLEALLPVIEQKALLVLEANRASDIVAALGFAKEQQIRIAILGGAEAYLVSEALAAAKTMVIVTPSGQTPQDFDQLGARDDVLTLLHRAHVSFAISTMASVSITRLRQEAGQAVAYGLPHHVALAAITRAPAELYGRGAELGSIAVGKRASFVLWSGDPLEVTSVAEHVFIDGVEQSLESRQRALVRRYLGR